MADHSKPTVTSTYANFVTELDTRIDDVTLGLDPAYTAPTNVPTNALRFSSAATKWQRWNGSSWVDAAATYAVSITGNANTVTNGVYTSGSYADPAWITSIAGSKVTGNIGGNAATATQLATSRTINGQPFNGTANISINLNTNLTFNNGGSGSSSGVTFNGGTATTISYNTVGAPSTTGANASGNWGINITGNAATATSATNATNATNATKLATTGFSIEESGGKLIFKNGSTVIASMTSAGEFIALGNVTGAGTP
jgi:hypothetical protein